MREENIGRKEGKEGRKEGREGLGREQHRDTVERKEADPISTSTFFYLL